MSFIDNLRDLLQKDPKNFFPKLPSTTILPPVGSLPLLELLNSSVAAPKLPLTITALEQIGEDIGKSELDTLNSNLLDLVKFKSTKSPADVQNDLKAIFTGLENLVDQAVEQAVTLVASQVVIGASLLSIVTALEPANFDSVFTAQGEYFFGHPADPKNPAKGTAPGYMTIAGEIITPPTLPSMDSVADLTNLPKLLSSKSGEQYVRDLTRVGLEAVANTVWNLEARYEKIAANAKLPAGDPNIALKINDPSKAQTWFKGFADYAEAAVTSAVEQALSQSGGPVPANSLLAAGIATAAGTAARKASQHIFLEEIGIGL